MTSLRAVVLLVTAILLATLPLQAQYSSYPDAEWIIGGSTSSAVGAVFAPDERYAISAHENGELRVWDVDSSRLVRFLRTGLPPIRCMDIARRRAVLAVGLATGDILLLDAHDGRTLDTLTAHDGAINCLSISRDEQYLVSGGSDRRVIVWNLDTGDTLISVYGGKSDVNCVDISPNDSLIASANGDFTVGVWAISTGVKLREFIWSLRAKGAVRFFNDNRLLAAFHDETFPYFDQPVGLQIFDIVTGESVAEAVTCPTRSVRLSPDDSLLFVACVRWPNGASWGGWYVYDVNELLHQSSTHPYGSFFWSPLMSIDVASDGRRALLGGLGYGVYLRRVDSAGAPVQTDSLTANLSSVDAVQVSPNSTMIVSGNRLGTLQRRTAAAGTLAATVVDHGPEIRGIAFSPDGSTMATCAMDGAIKLWNVATDSLVRILYASADNSVNDAAWSPDGGQVAGAVGPMDSTVVVFDTASVGPRVRLFGHRGGLWSIVWTPDGTSIISAGDDHEIRIWNAVTGTTRSIAEGHTDRITALALSPDGHTLASASVDQSIRLWSVPSGDPLGVLLGHVGTVNDVAFTPDGTHVVSAGEDASIRVWDIASGTETHRYDAIPYSATSLVMTPDGHHIVAGYEDGSIVLWKYRAVARVRSASLIASNVVVPNPFRERASVVFQVSQPGRVVVALYDLRGRLVERVFDGEMSAGAHSAEISGLVAGAYVYRVQSADSVVDGVVVCQ